MKGRKEAWGLQEWSKEKVRQYSQRDGQRTDVGGLLGAGADFGFYPKCDGRTMRGFKWGLHMI